MTGGLKTDEVIFMWKRGTALLTALLMLFSCALAEDVYLDEPTPEAAEETADDA